LWNVEDAITRGQRWRRTKGRGSCRRHNCAICGVEAAKKCGTGETEKWKAEEQRG